jgi:hypothetical protein
MVAYEEAHYNIFKEDLLCHSNERRISDAANVGVG